MKNLLQVVILAILLSCACQEAFTQNVGISANGEATDNSAGLDINFVDKGLLIPRVSLTSTTDNSTIPSPAVSLLVYNTNAAMTSGSTGYWYWNGTAWSKLSEAGTPGWSVLGNAGTAYGTHFVGTTDNVGLSLRTNNFEALHIDSLQNVSIGIANTVHKLEVNGSFRMHKDSFNVFYTPDILPNYFPGVQFVGSKLNLPSTDATFINGIADLPPAAGGMTYGIAGYLDPANGRQNLLLTAREGASINIQSGDTSGNIGADSHDVSLYHSINNIGNSNLHLADSSFNVNVNENITNSRNTNIQMRPDDFNVYNNNNAAGNALGYHSNSDGFNYWINSNNLNKNTYFGGQIGELKLYLNDNAVGAQTGFDITDGNTSFFNNDNSQGNNAAYGLTNNSFAINVNNNTDNRNTVFRVDQENLSFNQYNNNTAANSALQLSDNGVSFSSNDGASSTTFLMNGTTGSFNSNNNFALGVGTTSPNSTFESAGSFGTAITTTSSDITLDKTHYTVIVNGGVPVITLPGAAWDNNRRTYRLINQTGSPISISSYIDFTGTYIDNIPANSKIEVQSDGANWYKVD